MNFICEGIDRIGKDSLINGIINSLGYFNIFHKQAPEVNQYYSDLALKLKLSFPNANLYMYQCESFISDMVMLKQAEVKQFNLIMNRSWIGEAVYAKRYRGYDGNFVFDLEKISGIDKLDKTLLVLLYTSSFDFIKDDGKSLDFSKKEEEQKDFIEAFNRSIIKHKLMLDVHDGSGGFVRPEKLLDVVIKAYNEGEQLDD